jgi:hypothetical protein
VATVRVIPGIVRGGGAEGSAADSGTQRGVMEGIALRERV